MTDGDEDSNTALHLAATGGHIKLVETLLNLGAEPEVRLELFLKKKYITICFHMAGHCEQKYSRSTLWKIKLKRHV